MSRPAKDLRVNPQANKGECRILDNHIPCNKKSMIRGLCANHYSSINKRNLLDKYGLPARQHIKFRYKLVKKRKKKICGIIENKKVCRNEAQTRGLCRKHYIVCFHNKMLDEFALPPQKNVPTYSVNKECQHGQCRIIELGKICNDRAYYQGVCSNHYLKLFNDNKLKKFTLQKLRVYDIYEPKNQMICRITEDSTPCHQRVIGRGLCQRHYRKFYRNGQLEKFALQTAPKQSVCTVEDENGKCDCTSFSRGLCKFHYLKFYRNGTLEDHAKGWVNRIKNSKIY